METVQWQDLAAFRTEIDAVADGREEQKRAYRSTRALASGSTHRKGLLGEWAFALFTGLPVEGDVSVDGDRGWDFRLPKGYTVDVKAVTHPDPILKHPAAAEMTADVYVLSLVDEPNMRAALCGWCWASELAEAETQDFGYGPQRSIHHSELRRMPKQKAMSP